MSLDVRRCQAMSAPKATEGGVPTSSDVRRCQAMSGDVSLKVHVSLFLFEVHDGKLLKAILPLARGSFVTFFIVAPR